MQRPPLPLLLPCLGLLLLQLQLPMQSLSLLPLLLQFTYSRIHTYTRTHTHTLQFGNLRPKKRKQNAQKLHLQNENKK